MSIELGSLGVALAPTENECQAELLAALNASLHAMSQPLTALLCMLGYGAGMEEMDELKEVVAGGLEQCDRLMESVKTMQMRVVETQILLIAERKEAARTHL